MRKNEDSVDTNFSLNDKHGTLDFLWLKKQTVSNTCNRLSSDDLNRSFVADRILVTLESVFLAMWYGNVRPNAQILLEGVHPETAA